MAKNKQYRGKLGPAKKAKKGEREKLLVQLRNLGVSVQDPRTIPVTELRQLAYEARTGGHDV